MEPTASGDYVTIAPVTLKARQNMADQKRIQANAGRVQRLPRMRSSNGQQRTIGYVNPLSGTKKVLVILVNFSDVQFRFSNADFSNRYTADSYTSGGHIASVEGYFRAQSYGNFDIDIDVVGPVTLPNKMAYYGANTYSGEDIRPQEMVTQAVKLADSQVNYADYDWDGDGTVEQVFIVYAGYAEAQLAPAETIWPHASSISPTRLDGVYIENYACTAELSGNSGTVMDGIGTFCHEFSHCLGYPDLYDVDYTTNGEGPGMGSYDLMSSGSYNGPAARGEVPCGYSAYERWMAGWLDPIVLTSSTEVTDLASVASQPQAYVVYNPSNSNEYLIIENRQSDGFFRYCNNYIMSSGLLISHVNYNRSLWENNSINNFGSDQYYTFIPADKSYTVNSQAECQGDYFRPGNKLTADSHKSVYGAWRNGSSTFTGMDITDITMSAGKMGFKFGDESSSGGNAIETVDDHGIITAVTGVEPKYYQRDDSGTTYFLNSENELAYAYQSGTVEVVEDGNNVWIKDPLTYYTPSSWIKGTRNGNTISFPVGQPLEYISNYDATLSLRWGSIADGFNVADSYSDVITFTVSGNSLILQGTTSLLTSMSDGYVIGVFWDDDDTYAGYWDAETVLNYDSTYTPPSTELVELPAGATVQDWYLNGGNSDGSSIKNQDVRVAFVGGDVYVQGIFVDFPDSWVKGTIEGSTVTFSKLQYLGDFSSFNIWMVGTDGNGGITDAEATYDKSAKTITFATDILANAKDTEVYYLTWLQNVVLSATAVVYEEPVLTDLTSTLPYVNTFDTDDELAEVKVYDANEDGKTFTSVKDNGSNAFRYVYNTANDADDYLVFPGLPLEAGVTYRISVDARVAGASYPERLEVVCGKEAKVSAFTIPVIQPTDLTNTQYQTLANVEFTVDESGTYYFAIHAISDADQYNLFVDNFKVKVSVDNDLAATGITVPFMVKSGDDINVVVGIENMGTFDVPADAYSVDLFVNGEKAGSVAGNAIAADAKAEVDFTIPTSVLSPATMDIYAEIVFAQDEDTSNNVTDVSTVMIDFPDYPVATGLEAVSRRGGVALAWTEPEFGSSVTESFENYASFRVDEAGDWSFVDADGSDTYGFSGITFDNNGLPMAFIVFDQSISASGLDGFAYTGNQAMACFASDGARNDDWMISPMLDGSAQTVTFMARSWTTQYGSEEFEFLYSTTDNDIASFTKLHEDHKVPDSWTEYSFDLPEGTKYFAIHCVSNDRFVFIVDDVTYIPAPLEIAGYNIYRNGVKVNDEPVAATAYTDAEGAEGDEYTVTVVYTKGESAPCASVIAEALIFTPGDVNGDGAFSAVDVSMVVSYVLGQNPAGGIPEAADVNGDGSVSAVDVSLVVSYILSGRQIDAPRHAKAMEAATAEISDIALNADGNLELSISGISAYAAAQFDIALPEGVAVMSVNLRGSDGTGHSVAFSHADGTARVLAYSPANRNFGADATFEIELQGGQASCLHNQQGNISSQAGSLPSLSVDGIRLVEVAGRDIAEAAATGCAADFDLTGLLTGLVKGIDIKATSEGVTITAPAECDITISDTLGRTFRHHLNPGITRIALTQGVYFVNNKKVIVK